MTGRRREPWFKQRKYGIGPTPNSASGWMTFVIYLLLVRASFFLKTILHAPPWHILAAIIIITIAYLFLNILMGDGKSWKWRWGRD